MNSTHHNSKHSLAERCQGLRRIWMRIAIPTAGSLALLMLSSIGCNQQDQLPTLNLQKTGSPNGQVKFEQIKQIDMQRTIELPISFEGYERTILVPRVVGYISQVNVDIGDLVTAGQVLAEIDVPDLQAETQRREKLLVQSQKQHASMQAKLEQAKSQQQERRSLQQLRQAELERVATLVENGSLSRERLDEAKFALASAVASLASVAADIAAAEADVASAAAAIEVAQAELDKSKSMQNFRKILAPFDGLITMRQVDTGAYVVPSTDPTKALFKVEEISRLRGVIYLPLEMASQVSSGKKVEIHSVAGSKELVINEDAQGKPITITRSSGVLNQESRLMRAEIELQPPVNPTTRLVVLKPGDYATARIMLEAFPQQAAVPRSALIYEGKEKYIFIAGADQVCHKLQVNVVAQQDDWIGVTPKETIDGSLETRRVAVSNLDSIHEKQKLTDRKVTDGQVQSED